MTDSPAAPTLDTTPPLLNKRGLLMALGIAVVLWISAAMTGSKIVIGIVAVLTLVAIGGLIWLWRRTRQQNEVLQLLQSAQSSPEARRAALEQLAAQDSKGGDVLSQLARAQLEAQDDPDRALETLSAMDLSKVPAEAADQVRTFRAQLLLLKNRVREAREVVDRIVISPAGAKAGRAMIASVVGETWARSGRGEEAMALLEEFKPDDPELAQIRPMLLFARVFAQFGAGKKERARKDMKALMAEDANLLGRFVAPGPGVHIELRTMASELLRTHPDMKRYMRQQPSAMQRRMR